MSGYTRVIAGVDVGTSLSKVVVKLGKGRLAVPFADTVASESSRFVVPTAFSVMDADCKCLLGLRGGASRTVTDIKMPLIDKERSFNDEDRLHLTAFMALLFRWVWKWAQDEVARTLGSRTRDWAVNLGVPTDSYDDHEIKGEYSRCAMAAWRLAESPREQRRDDLTLAECREVLDWADGPGAASFGVFPEFVAQVSSYVQTPLRKEGIHVMVDAGGGTLDVTVFMVLPSKGNEDQVFPVFARAVERLGTRYLVRGRWRDANPDCCPEPDPFRDLPSEAETAGLLGITVDRLGHIDQPFHQEVVRCIAKTVKRAAGKGGLDPYWPGRLFLVGGGASIELFQRAVREYKAKKWKYTLNDVELPRPDDLEMDRSGRMKWHRLAVAYGLSFDPDDIGRIRPPDDIEKVNPVFWKPPDQRPRWLR